MPNQERSRFGFTKFSVNLILTACACTLAWLFTLKHSPFPSNLATTECALMPFGLISLGFVLMHLTLHYLTERRDLRSSAFARQNRIKTGLKTAFIVLNTVFTIFFRGFFGRLIGRLMGDFNQ